MALGSMTPAFAQKRIALVVGNTSYVHVPRLANPGNDARLMAETLAGLGFALVGGGAQLDLDKAGLDRAVKAFGQQLQGAEVGLFYYAGHGVQVRGANYLVPIGANPTREADVDFELLDANVVLRQMEGAGTRLNLMILDACRNNPFGGRGLRSADAGLAQMRAPEGTLISFATQPGNVAHDGRDGNSPYSKALAQTIRKPGLDIFRTFNEVGLAVSSATGGAQQPWVSLSPIKGEFYFAGLPPSAAPPSVASPAAPKPAAGLFPEVQGAPAPLTAERERALKPKDTFKECGECPEMVVVPAGSFTMGSPASEANRNDNEGPQHTVTIPKALAVAKFEVTFEQWEACMVDRGCYRREVPVDARYDGPRRPKVDLTWEDARRYVAWLSKKTGKTYRLLSEAEWEYAARAGTTTPYVTGARIARDQANFDGYISSNKSENQKKTTPVGSFAANPFGLHDMHGNVSEWVEDCWNDDYSHAPSDRSAWTAGDCDYRIVRGGSWYNEAKSVRSAVRHKGRVDYRDQFIGFRVARTLAP
jgi:formylglycine-generating enzyme required for sulfatase activity